MWHIRIGQQIVFVCLRVFYSLPHFCFCLVAMTEIIRGDQIQLAIRSHVNPSGRLVACFDCTYLHQVLQQHTFGDDGEVRIVGGAWTYEDPENASWDPVEGSERDSRKIKKATDMSLVKWRGDERGMFLFFCCDVILRMSNRYKLDEICFIFSATCSGMRGKHERALRFQLLVWDPSSETPLALPAAEMPVHCADYNAKLVLRFLDEFLWEARGIVKILVFDGRKAHYSVRRLLFGTATQEDHALVADCNCQFFSKIKYKDLPEHPLPRLPLRLACVDGESYHCFPAPCFLDHFGSYWITCQHLRTLITCFLCSISRFTVYK